VNCVGIDLSDVGIDFCRKRGMSAYRGDIAANVLPEAVSIFKYDYVVSLGSLEHVVDIDAALENIFKLLKDDGTFYFFCPNDKWKHFDQPNERTAHDSDWVQLFARHGLVASTMKRWNDSTAFIGTKCEIPAVLKGYPLDDSLYPKVLAPHGDKLNVGSGQRPFNTAHGWINVDSQPKWQPDVVRDWNDLSIFPDNSMDMVVSHHSLEHVGCGEGDGFIREAFRVLKPGGSLIVAVPDLRALALRWLTGELDTQIYLTNLYGAYMGDEADRHKWGYDQPYLLRSLQAVAPWSQVRPFDFRSIEGADIARAWWILAMEAVK
jgi:SAM-dependent methyltransferase